MVALLQNLKALIQGERTVDELPINRTTAAKECVHCLQLLRQATLSLFLSIPVCSSGSSRHRCYVFSVCSAWFPNPSYYLLKMLLYNSIICSSFICFNSFQRTGNLQITPSTAEWIKKQHKEQVNKLVDQSIIQLNSQVVKHQPVNQPFNKQ